MTVYLIIAVVAAALGVCIWFGRAVLREHPIRIIALLCVASIGIFLGYMTVWLTNTLSSPGWCGKALQAERMSAENFGGLQGCISILTIQLKALADVLKMSVGSFSFGLVVLIVIVLAGARANFAAPGGFSGNISPGEDKDPAVAAANKVAGAAVAEAAEVKADAPVVAPAPPPTEPRGPAMPEPKD